MLPRRLFSGTIISVLGRIIGTVISIFTVAVMTRALIGDMGVTNGINSYGIYASALAYLAIITIIADGGLYVIFTREASKTGADERKILETTWFLRVFAIILTILGSLLAVLFLPYGTEVRLGVLVGVWGVAFQLASQLLLGVFQKKLELSYPALAEVAGRAVQLLGVLISAYFHKGIYFFLGAFVLGTVITFLINYVGAQKLVPFRIFVKPDTSLAKKIMWEAFPMGVSLVLSVIFFKIDSVMLSVMRPAQDLAYYALPYKVLESLLFFPAMIGGLLLPIFSQAGTESPSGMKSHLRDSFDVYVFTALPLSGVVWILSPAIIYFLGGESYSQSIPVLRILSLALVVLFFGNLFGSAIVAIGKQKTLVYLYGFLVLFNICLNYFFIPKYSFIGAAWITLITEIISASIAFLILTRNGTGVLGSRRTSKFLLAFSVFILMFFLPTNDFVKVFVSCFSYIVTVFWLKALTPRQLMILFNLKKNVGA